MVKESKGGVFSTADFPLIKKALYCYLEKCNSINESERDPHPDVNHIANLLHRLTSRL
jgi:hypothetical protein